MHKSAQRRPLQRLHDFGQSPWLDYIDRTLIHSGELGRLVSEEGIRGVTSNPAIFEHAITSSDAYDEAIEGAGAAQGAAAIYEDLVLDDIRAAADVLFPIYEESAGCDGFVSLEVSPHLADQTEPTVQEAHRLWAALDRPNVMIKVPATGAGLPAVRQLIGDGISVNVTLLFGLERYREVVAAYHAGLRDRAERGESLGEVSSVASFFLSRIDTLVDGTLARIAATRDPHAGAARRLQGEVAIACAQCAYGVFRECFESPGSAFESLRALGAHPQRLLWASTSSKDPAFSDTKYVEPLIAVETVTTLPPATLRAYADHGDPSPWLVEGLRTSREKLEEAEKIGIDLDEVSECLLREGLRKFKEPYDSLLKAIERKRNANCGGEGA